MTADLKIRLARLRRRVRAVCVLFAASWVAGGGVGTVGAACLLDYHMRLGADVRVLLLVGCLGAVAWVVYRYAYRVLGVRLDDLALALKVERRFPQLNDRLASAVQFASAGGTGESRAMMQAVVRETHQAVRELPLEQVATARALRVVGPVAGVLVCLAVGLLVANPALGAVGLARLFNPFGAAHWPRRTDLAFLDAPDTVRRGTPYRFTGGVARGEIPERISVRYTYDNGLTHAEELVPDARGRIAGRFTRTERSFTVVLACREHRTDAHRVRAVVPPPEPRIEHIQLTLTHPAYTRRARQKLPPGQGKVVGLRGTRVDVEARSDRALVAAGLEVGQDAHPVRMGPDRRTLTADFSLVKNSSYRFRMRTSETSNDHPVVYPIVVQPDRAPTVVFDQPGMDLQVSPEAEIALVVTVTDDLAVAGADLVFRTDGGDKAKPVTVPLFRDQKQYVRKQVVAHTWALEPLGLHPGQVVLYWGTAFDYDDVSGPNVGKSRRQYRLQIVSRTRLAEIFEQRQIQLRQQIEQVLQLQQRTHRGVADLQTRLDMLGQLKRADIESVQTTELSQQQVERKVSHPSDGLAGQVRRLLAEMGFNKFKDTDTRDRLKEVLDQLDQLGREHLPPIGRKLTGVRKSAQAGAEKTQADPQRAAREQRRDLTEVAEAQRAVIAALQDMLRRFDRWETYREVVREAGDALRDQKKLADRTRQVGQQTLGKPVDELTGAQKTALAKASRDQGELKRRQEQLERKMARLSERLRSADPLGTDTLREARRQAQEADIAGQMRQAATRLEANQVGSARTHQKQAVAALGKLVNTLRNRREKELAFLLRRLKQAEKELAEQRKKQLALLRKTREADTLKPEERKRELLGLAKRQQRLEQAIRELSQRLRRLTAGKASRQVRDATSVMQEAARQLGKADAGGAGDKQQQALDGLDRAARELAQRRREVEEELAVEQLVKMAEELRQIHQRQKQALKETVRLDKLGAGAEGLTRGQLRSVALVGSTQKTIREDTQRLIKRLDSAPVFRLVLKRGASNMEVAQKRLAGRLTDADTQQAQQRAAKKLGQLLDALKPGQGGEAKGGGAGGGGGRGRGGAPGVPPVAQVKLLRDLQVDINERTVTLGQKARAGKTLSDDQQAQIKALSQDQASLADLVRELTEPKGTP